MARPEVLRRACGQWSTPLGDLRACHPPPRVECHTRSGTRMHAVLVTGGCGFIGSNFIHYLLENDPERQSSTSIPSPTPATWPTWSAVARHPRYRFVKGDITTRGPSGGPGLPHYPFRRRNARRSQHPEPGPLSRPTSSAPRWCSKRPSRPASKTSIFPPMRFTVPGQRASRSDSPGPEQPLRRQQGGRRSAGAQLFSHLRAARSSPAAPTTTGPSSSPRS